MLQLWRDLPSIGHRLRNSSSKLTQLRYAVPYAGFIRLLIGCDPVERDAMRSAPILIKTFDAGTRLSAAATPAPAPFYTRYGRQTNLTYARPRRRPASAGPVARGGAARGTEVPDVRRNLAVITYPAGARF